MIEADIFENGALIKDRFWMGSPDWMFGVLCTIFGRRPSMN